VFFSKVIKDNGKNTQHYLEVGGGHGLYASEAISIIGDKASYDIVDISQSSIDIAKKMINNDNVNYNLSDVFEYSPGKKFDFITMGEVLEHVEEPLKLLEKLFTLLTDDGKLFITVPTNGPTIDHIYLFNNADEIREMIYSAGFQIKNEFCIYSENLPAEIAEKYKVSMMFAGLLVKQSK
jgi:2-polyprenyl-3-methyl-5-hydroxy-6-metoxy-1,4-benzoquinol methylase